MVPVVNGPPLKDQNETIDESGIHRLVAFEGRREFSIL